MKPYFAMPEDGWYNIAIAGEFPHSTGYVQVLDSQAFKAIVEDVHAQQGQPNWPGILIDFDHGSLDTDKPSTAAGWLTDIEERPDGLWARIRWSDKGQRSLEGGEFRFVSPVWMLADCEDLGEKRVRPRRLANCAITNAPNIRGMVPLTNRAEEKGVRLSPEGRELPIQNRVEVPKAALEAIGKLENRRALTEKQRKLLWARAGGFYGGNGDPNPYQNANKIGRAAAGTPGKESKATTNDILAAKEQARKQAQYMHDYIKRKAKPEVKAKEEASRQEKNLKPGSKIKKIQKAHSGGKTWGKQDTGSKKYGRKLKKGKQIERDIDQRRGRREDNAKETLKKSILSLVNRARLAAFLANTSWEDMTEQQRRWWWAQMNGGGGGSAVNPYTGSAPTSADNPWANEGTPANPYAQLYGNGTSEAESAFWREVYKNANDPNWKPSEDFGRTSDVDGLFSPEGWAAHQKLAADLNQQLRDEYDRIAKEEARAYLENQPAFTSPSTWDYFSAAVEDFGAGMAYGVGNLIDAIADLPQENITGIPDTLALLARGGSWLIGGNGSIAGKLQTFADAVHDFVDPKAQWAKDKLGLSQMIDELGRNYSGSDWAAKTSKVSATVFAIAVDMLVGLGGLAYSKGLKGIVKLGGTLNDATKIALGMATKKQILAKDILGAIRNLNIENATKGIDADVLRKFAKQDLDEAMRQLDEALDLNRAMSAQRKMEEIREIERKWANIDAQRMRIPAEEARHADDLAAHEAKLARERAAQDWYDSNILKADREAEAARLANPNADAEARALARENPASLGSQTAQVEKVATRAEAAAPGTNNAALELAKERLDALDDPIAKMEAWQNGTPESYAAYSREIEAARAEVARLESGLPATGTRELTAAKAEKGAAAPIETPAAAAERASQAAEEAAKRNAASGWTWEQKHDQAYASQWGMSLEEARGARLNREARTAAEETIAKKLNVPVEEVRNGTKYADEINAELGYAGRGKSVAFKPDDPGAVKFAERNPTWEKVANEDGTFYFQQPAAKPVTRTNLDEAVSGLKPTKNEVVGGMYDAASSGGSYSDDAGRLLVDNGEVTPAGQKLVRESVREQVEAASKAATPEVPKATPTAGKAATENPWQKLEEAAESIRRTDAAEDALRAKTKDLSEAIESIPKYIEDQYLRSAAYDRLKMGADDVEKMKSAMMRSIDEGTTLHDYKGNLVVKDGKLTQLGEKYAPDFKGRVPSTKETGVVVGPRPQNNADEIAYMAAKDAEARARSMAAAASYKAPEAKLSEAQRAFLEKNGRFSKAENVEAYNLLTDAGMPPKEAVKEITSRKGTTSMDDIRLRAKDMRATNAKQAEYAVEAEKLQAAREARKTEELKRKELKEAVDTLFGPLASSLEQPSVAKTAHAIDKLTREGGETGSASQKVLLPMLGAGIAVLSAGYAAKGIHETFGSEENQNMVVMPEDARTRTQSPGSPPPPLNVPVAPDGTVLWYHVNDPGRDSKHNPPAIEPFRVRDESGALLDAKGRVRDFADDVPRQPEETGYDWNSMGIMGDRTRADDKPHLMDAIRASAPGVSELRKALAAVEPQYVKIERKIPPAEPTAEQVEMVRQNAGVTVKQNAESLKIRINQLEQERADLQARTYAVPVPEMRPTEYQNIQQVRAAAAAQPGATSTSILDAITKAKKENSAVSHLKAELNQAVKGAGSDKQRAKAEEEVLRRFNAEYYDAIERNEANDKNAAKRLAKIESQLDTLNRAYGYAQERTKNAEDRAEEKLRTQTRRESEKAERKQEREQREADRKARYEASLKVKALKAGIRSLERQATSEYKHNQEVWRLVMEGVTEGKQEFHNAALELEPRLDWNAAVSFMRGVYASTKGAKDKKTGRPRTEKERKGLAKGQVFGIELPLLEEVAG